jgi:hypothetical protein
MIRRTGATLIEVLVAIFVMGVGLLALLALFPIGVLTMRQAIQDDRTAHAAASATAIARMKVSPSKYDVYFKRADTGIANAMSDAPPEGPSYPLLLDTVGYRLFTAGLAPWVGSQPFGGIRRLPFPELAVNHPNNNPLLWQISPDDIKFDPNGAPLELVAGGGVFERNSAYSWAYLLRRPLQGQPGVVNLTVVVFNERPLTLNNTYQGGETIYYAEFAPGSNLVKIKWDGTGGLATTQPDLRIGGWILDSTPVLDPKTAPPTQKLLPSYAQFYRMVSVLQTSDFEAELELQDPVPLTHPPTGTFLVIDGIAEVFEKGPIQWQNP